VDPLGVDMDLILLYNRDPSIGSVTVSGSYSHGIEEDLNDDEH
jgi:hypothetical protein